MNRSIIALAVLCFPAVAMAGSYQASDAQAIEGYLHRVIVLENRFGRDNATMFQEMTGAMTGNHVTNAELRSIISQSKATLEDIEMLTPPHLHDPQAAAAVQSANSYFRAYGANADRELNQFFRLAPATALAITCVTLIWTMRTALALLIARSNTYCSPAPPSA
ncbi:MAG: hypothetical protein ACYDEV_09185 [Acidiferrobacter sp.]